MNDKKDNEPASRLRKILYDSKDDKSETQFTYSARRSMASKLPEPLSSGKTQPVPAQQPAKSAQPKRTWK